ncbi:Uncharacterised protein [Chlamydia trachomatis]|nr:Uncharacterised protein [Chlamydia trachomatis]
MTSPWPILATKSLVLIPVRLSKRTATLLPSLSVTLKEEVSYLSDAISPTVTFDNLTSVD